MPLWRVGDAVEDLFLLRFGAIREIVVEQAVAFHIEPGEASTNFSQNRAMLEVKPIVDELRHARLSGAARCVRRQE